MAVEDIGMGVATPGPRPFYDRYFWYIVAITLLVVVLGLLYVKRQNNTIVWDGVCEAVNHRQGISLVVDCAGKQFEINDRGVAFSYALNPGPLGCKAYAMGSPTCSPRPFKK